MKSKIFALWLSVMLMASAIIMTANINENVEAKSIVKDDVSHIVSTPFRINNDTDFTSSPKVTGGDGSIGTPWIIENFAIDGTGAGYCLYIGNTTDHFIVRNCYLNNSNGFGSPWDYYGDAGIILYNAANGKVHNCTMFNNAQFGAFVSSSNNITISNCNLSSTSEGVTFYNTIYSTIANCSMFDTSDGVWFTQATRYNTVINNTAIGGSSSGILLNHALCRNNTIIYNNVSYSDEGIMIEHSDNNTITGNIAHNCPSWDGIWVLDSESTTIADNVVNGTISGISISNADNTYISGNSGVNNDVLIQVENSDGCIITDNNASWCNQVGIYSGSACNFNTISNNEAWNNGWHGIYWTAGQNNEISGNTVSGNLQWGIYLTVGNNVLVNNTAEYNTDGGLYVQSSGNTISGNFASNNLGDGIRLLAGSLNTISLNEVRENGGYGFYLTGSSNTLYHNNIMNNVNQAYDDSINFWNLSYPSGGNYWSDYAGVDSNNTAAQNVPPADGMGDTPYTDIDGGAGAMDNYPLMQPFNTTNNPPVIITIDNVGAFEDGLYSVDYNAIDLDGDALVWALDTNATLWLSIDMGTGILSGTPTNSDVGLYWANVTVSDGNGGIDCANFTLTVANTNDAPTGADSTVTMTEDSTYSFVAANFGFSDVDIGDTLSAVRIDTIATAGTLRYMGIDVTAGQVILTADIVNLAFTPATDENGAGYASFTFSVRDSTSVYDATPNNITIDVTAQNDAPTDIVLSSNTINENLPSGTVIGFFTTIDVDLGSTFTYSFVAGAGDTGNAQFQIVGSQLHSNAIFNYETQASYNIRVQTDDGSGGTYVEVFIINVTDVNDAPTGADSTVTMTEDSTYSFVAANFGFSDVDIGDTLSAVRIDTIATAGTLRYMGIDVTAGQVILTADIVNLAFTPATDENGAGYASFTFSVRDSTSVYDATPNNMTIDVTAQNDAPVLGGAGGPPLTYTEGDGPVVIDSTLTLSDTDDTNLESATIQITGNYQNGEDVLAFVNTVNIAGNWNVGLGLLTLTGTDTLANYELALESVTYSDANENPSTLARTVSWQVNDGISNSNIATSTINIVAVNDAPVLGGAGGPPLTYTEGDGPVVIDSTLTLSDTDDTNLESATVQITGNYQNGEDVLSFVNTSNIAGNWNAGLGLLTLTGTDTIANYELALESVTYSDANGNPSTLARTVSWQVNDGIADSNIATSTINLVAVNNAPMAAADGYTITEDGTLTVIVGIGVLANDTDAESSPLTAVLDADVSHGTLTLNLDGSFIYTPTTDYSGPDSFTYHANDGMLDSNIATVTISVTGINDPPVLGTILNKAVDELTLLSFAATATDPDIPANTLTFTLEGIPPAGASITSGGAFSWTPTEAQGPGFYNITVRVSDGTLFDNQIFMITVNEVNVAPVAANDAASVDEDSSANTIDILANDLDGDGNTLTIIAVTQGTHGTATIAGNTVEYTPTADYFGTDTFTYTINDGNGENATATVTVTITNVNDNPTAADDAATISEDSGARTILVLGNDGFAPDVSETLTIIAVTQGAHGTVAITTGGTRLTYTPTANYHGTDTFTYTISDGNGGTATGTVTVLVENVNDTPVITTDDVSTAVGGDNYTVDYDATDIDGGTLTWTLVTTADWLEIDAATGVLNGIAEVGTFSIQVIVSDGNGGSASSHFTLTVTQLDSDGDGVPDGSDAFPQDPNESADTDADGTGNNADTDDDDDAAPDAEDDFPLDPNETLDTDGDGTGNNADTDDDGDGVADADDPEPLNPAITGNEYDGGWPYWDVVMSIMVALLIALICLAIVWYLRRR